MNIRDACTLTLQEIAHLLRAMQPGIPTHLDPIPQGAVRHICMDSRRVQPETLFVAIRGTQQDGHRYIPEAVQRGCRAVIGSDPQWRDWLRQHHPGIPYWCVPRPREAAGRLARHLYAPALHRLTVFAVTGTKGKTTIVHWLHDALTRLGYRTARVGTLGLEPQVFPWFGLTTPEAPDLGEYVVEIVARGYTHLAIEASSIGLHQHRLDVLRVENAAFTNLGHDHLDYHPNLEEYFAAKARLFDADYWHLNRAVVNVEDTWGQRLAAAVAAQACTLYRVGWRQGRDDLDVWLEPAAISLSGSHGQLRVRWSPEPLNWRIALGGSHNLYNFLITFALLMDHVAPSDWPDLVDVLGRFSGVPGRLERLALPGGGMVIVDYAHTPESLEWLLRDLRRLARGRVLTLFGCGGNRDPLKRPQMGAVAARYSDYVVITDDNPRHEDPAAIARAIVRGLETDPPREGWRVIHDRVTAIRHILERAAPDDVVLIAGKGAETYQIYGDEKRPHSDIGTVQQWIQEYSARHVENS